MKTQVEGHNIVKDQYSSALLNTDLNKLQAHRVLKESKKLDHERITKLENEVKDIKNLLHQILNKL